MEILFPLIALSLLALVMYINRTNSQFFMSADKARRKSACMDIKSIERANRRIHMEDLYGIAMYWLKNDIKDAVRNGDVECSRKVERETPTIPVAKYFRDKGYAVNVSKMDGKKIIKINW